MRDFDDTGNPAKYKEMIFMDEILNEESKVEAQQGRLLFCALLEQCSGLSTSQAAVFIC